MDRTIHCFFQGGGTDARRYWLRLNGDPVGVEPVGGQLGAQRVGGDVLAVFGGALAGGTFLEGGGGVDWVAVQFFLQAGDFGGEFRVVD